MAARKNGVFVAERDRPTKVPYRVSGVAPNGDIVTFTQDGTDMMDALYMARKRAVLRDMTAEPDNERGDA
jgi:hypothetical protein